MPTDPEYDIRTWLNATPLADGELKIGFAKAGAANRKVLASDTLCSNVKYNAIQSTPWASFNKSVRRVTITADASRLANVNLNYWFHRCSALTSASGMANLRGVVCMNHAFNSCSALTGLDLQGMSPASLSSMLYTFVSVRTLRASWSMPSGSCRASARARPRSTTARPS